MNYTSFDGTTHFASYTFRRPSLLTRLKRFLLRSKVVNDDMVEDEDEREAMEGMRLLSLRALEREDWLEASVEGLERWEAEHGFGEDED